MQWMVTHNRLGTDQLTVLDRCRQMRQGRIWIQGVAGSGKTVLLVHAIREALAANPNLSVCVVVYTYALKDLVSTGLPEHLGDVPVVTYYSFLKDPKQHDIICVDEVQDLDRRSLSRLARYATKLIVAGDGDQSIYAKRATMDDIEQILSPEKHRLDVLYRITQTLREVVKTILPGTHIEGAKLARLATNVEIRLAHGKDISTEIAWVWRESRKYSKPGDPSAILLPKHRMIDHFIDHVCDIEKKARPNYPLNEYSKIDYDHVNTYLASQNLCLRYIGNDFGALEESDQMPIVYLMTYHSAKGLDFENVFLPNLDSDVVFWREDEALSRRLFFVATTRCRRNLFMSYHTQQPHSYVQSMPQHLLRKFEIPDIITGTDISDQEVF